MIRFIFGLLVGIVVGVILGIVMVSLLSMNKQKEEGDNGTGDL